MEALEPQSPSPAADPAAHVLYRDLVGYRYQLVQDYSLAVAILPSEAIHEPPKQPFLILDRDGVLTIKKGYAWDGPSGPTIDTPNFMRGSLVHDALYQLMRTARIGQEQRRYADDLLRTLCLQDGMSALRAWYVRLAVHWFAAGAAAVQPERSYVVHRAP